MQEENTGSAAGRDHNAADRLPEVLVAGDDIALALRSCAESYANVTAALYGADPDETSLSALRTAWDVHYRDAFARFDTLLRAGGETNDGKCLEHLPVSVSSHNLDRLFQVLVADGDRRLGDVRIQERAGDLVAMIQKLETLLATATRDASALNPEERHEPVRTEQSAFRGGPPHRLG